MSRTQIKNQQVHYLTLTEVGKMIEKGQLSSMELTKLILNRIDAIDKTLNSYITVMKQSALSRAKELDKELEAGKYRGPLHGVPVSLKDLLLTSNAPTTGGNSFMRDYTPTFNATVVDRLEEAGAIIVGKLNMTEGAIGGYHPDFKIVINPWGDWWTGFSSSGSGVAVAAGLCFGAIGTDTGGSITFPSLCNGIVGLKPSYGQVSRYGVLPLADSLDHVGPMTRSVEDAAIMYDIIAGEDLKDKTSEFNKVSKISKTIKKGILGLRVGVDMEYIEKGVDPSMVNDIKKAIKKITSLGAKIVSIKMPNKAEYSPVHLRIMSKEAALSHKNTFPSKIEEYGPYLSDFLSFGNSITKEQYTNDIKYRVKFRKQFRSLFSTVDAIIAPAGAIPKAPSEKILRGPMSNWEPTYTQQFGFNFATPANLAGTPSLTLPCGEASEKPPNGMQIMGGYLKEDIICRIGYEYQNSTNWHEQHPVINELKRKANIN